MSNAAYLGTTIDNPPLIAGDRPVFDASLAVRDADRAAVLYILDEAPVWGVRIPATADDME